MASPWTRGRVRWGLAAGYFYAYTGVTVPTGQVVGYNGGARTDLRFGEEPDMDYGYVGGVKPGFALVESAGDVVAMAVPAGTGYAMSGSWIFEPVSPDVDVEYGVTLVDDLGSTDLYSATATFTTTVATAGFSAIGPFDVVGDGSLSMWARAVNSGDTIEVVGIYLQVDYDDGAKSWH